MFSFWNLMYVIMAAALVGGFMEDAARKTRVHLDRIEAKLDALSAQNGGTR